MWRLRTVNCWEGRDGLMRARRWVVRFSILRYVFSERDETVEFWLMEWCGIGCFDRHFAFEGAAVSIC